MATEKDVQRSINNLAKRLLNEIASRGITAVVSAEMGCMAGTLTGIYFALNYPAQA